MAFLVGVGLDGDVRHALDLLGQHLEVGDLGLAGLLHALLVALEQLEVVRRRQRRQAVGQQVIAAVAAP